MKTKEQVKENLSLERVKLNLLKKHKKAREKWILGGWLLEILCYSLFGFLWGISIIVFQTFFKLLAIIFLAIGFYLAFDVGKKIQKDAIINYQDDIRKQI